MAKCVILEKVKLLTSITLYLYIYFVTNVKFNLFDEFGLNGKLVKYIRLTLKNEDLYLNDTTFQKFTCTTNETWFSICD